jgi:hypothetical protein
MILYDPPSRSSQPGYILSIYIRECVRTMCLWFDLTSHDRLTPHLSQTVYLFPLFFFFSFPPPTPLQII